MRVRFKIPITAVGLLVAGLLSSCGPPPDSYVALGDSYTSGPGITPQDTSIPGCLRSDANYPNLIALELGQPPLRDVSCSGAQTKDMTAKQDVDPDPDNPPQFDALDANTQIVTLGIGGNDIGFTEIGKTCVKLFPEDPTGSPCRDHYNEGGVDKIAARIATLAGALRKVLDGIDTRSPEAEVFVVGYPAILPETTVNFEVCQLVLPVAEGDVPWLRDDVEKRLNATIRYVAVSHGEVYVDTYGPSIGHDACQADGDRWVEPVVPATAAPLHPNSLGMEATKDAVLSTMEANGVDVG